ncbi:MAG TPA: glycosyltransferase family 4 protein [Acidobacteriaceae bacterium]|nr:glycosyltransferase family 4 protein [Acidobacteriaceae bacterium]
MSSITYHLLTEAEPFSEFSGGAISRWAGNVLRSTSHVVVVCPGADGTWNFAQDSIRVLPAMALYKPLRRRLQQLPWFFHCRVIRGIFQPFLKRVRSGDIVWIHNRPEFAVAITPLVHQAGGRVVLHLHNSHLVKGPERLMGQVRVDRLVFVSEFLLEQARSKFPDLGTSCVLYNGADPSIFFPAKDRQKHKEAATVLFAGRLVEDKGVHILLDAMRLLERQGVRLQAHIVGSSSFGIGKETDYTRRLKANSPATVEFLPYRSGMGLGDLFRGADMFCSPSLWDEPFGLVNIEAFASGLPVVSTYGGGSGEIFAHGGGILVERGSAVQLASALRQLAENPELRTRLGQQGYAAFLESFTWLKARAQVERIEKALSV